MRGSLLALAFLLIAVPAYGQEPERLDVGKRFVRSDLAAVKAPLGDKYVPSLAISVITPPAPGAVLTGATFVTSPALRLGVQWSF